MLDVLFQCFEGCKDTTSIDGDKGCGQTSLVVGHRLLTVVGGDFKVRKKHGPYLEGGGKEGMSTGTMGVWQA